MTSTEHRNMFVTLKWQKLKAGRSFCWMADAIGIFTVTTSKITELCLRVLQVPIEPSHTISPSFLFTIKGYLLFYMLLVTLT